MPELLMVHPAEGRTILHPETGKPIPATGQKVPVLPDIRRALRRGDLVNGAPSAKRAAKQED